MFYSRQLSPPPSISLMCEQTLGWLQCMCFAYSYDRPAYRPNPTANPTLFYPELPLLSIGKTSTGTCTAYCWNSVISGVYQVQSPLRRPTAPSSTHCWIWIPRSTSRLAATSKELSLINAFDRRSTQNSAQQQRSLACYCLRRRIAKHLPRYNCPPAHKALELASFSPNHHAITRNESRL